MEKQNNNRSQVAKRLLIFATVLESENSLSGGEGLVWVGSVGLLTPTFTFVVLLLSMCCTHESVYLRICAGFVFDPALFSLHVNNTNLTELLFIHSLVFSLRGRAGRNQSPVM